MTRTLSAGDNIVDSRDVIERLAELEEYRDASLTTLGEHKERIAELEAQGESDGELPIDLADELSRLPHEIWTAEDGTEYAKSVDWDEETEREWKQLTTLCEDAEGYSVDWKHGATLILDSYFEDYARELAEDIGAINKNATWPNDCIDWEQAADQLKADYTSVEWAGFDYWVR